MVRGAERRRAARRVILPPGDRDPSASGRPGRFSPAPQAQVDFGAFIGLNLIHDPLGRLFGRSEGIDDFVLRQGLKHGAVDRENRMPERVQPNMSGNARKDAIERSEVLDRVERRNLPEVVEASPRVAVEKVAERAPQSRGALPRLGIALPDDGDDLIDEADAKFVEIDEAPHEPVVGLQCSIEAGFPEKETADEFMRRRRLRPFGRRPLRAEGLEE